MTLKIRPEKMADKLKPEATKIYFMGWADCTWSESEGLIRNESEPKDGFCNRVYQTTKKHFLRFS
jgi:hypothetical protein